MKMILAGIFLSMILCASFCAAEDNARESQKCKVYASPCCSDGYVCALSEPKCNMGGVFQCKISNPPALTRVYCVYHSASKDYSRAGCYERPLYGGANCKEYCDY